jgi:hypothetical protein
VPKPEPEEPKQSLKLGRVFGGCRFWWFKMVILV